jgi:uncharacterized phage protein (TIGR02218 family)
MIATTLASEPIYLLPHAPLDTLRVGLSLATQVTRSLGGATTRRPEYLLPRWSLEWSARLLGSEFQRLRAASRVAQAERVAVPHWLFARQTTDAAVTTGGHVVAWTEDWATWAIDPGSLAAYDYVAPLLLGYLAPARLEAITDEAVTAALSFDEDADAADAVTIAAGVLAADTMFATASGYSAPVFPFLHDPATPPAPGLHGVSVDRQAIGAGRRKAQVYFPQIPEETHQATVRAHGASAAAALAAWWIRRKGGAAAHWVAGSQAVARLAVSAPAGAAALVCDTPALSGETYLALYDPAGALELARVTSWTGATANLAAPLAAAWEAAYTTLAPAFLARHTDKELTFDCVRTSDGWLASASLSWREVAAEYAPAAGETRGVTLGELPPAAVFLQIDLDYAGATETWRLTNWESGATANGHDWTYNPCTIDQLVRSLDPEDDACTITARHFPGGPWDNWLPGRLAARAFLTVYRADYVGGAWTNWRHLFHGELGQPTGRAIVRQQASGGKALFSRDVPRQLMTPMCGTELFSPRCTLARADWTFTATLATTDSAIVGVSGLARANGGGLPAGFGAADWFALGYLEWTDAGKPRRSLIVASTAVVGGAATLTLSRPTDLPVGTAVVLVPGCDRRGATCREKFGNYAHFQGYEDMPSVSPSFKIPNATTTATKK